jgi:hypothetical protein
VYSTVSQISAAIKILALFSCSFVHDHVLLSYITNLFKFIKFRKVNVCNKREISIFYSAI